MTNNSRTVKNVLIQLNAFFKNIIFPPYLYKKLFNLFDSFISLTKKIFNKKSRYFKDLKEKGKERVFIIANGPSLSSVDILPLATEDVITMNFFIRHKNSNKIIPKYHVMADPADFPDAAKNLNKALKINADHFILHSSSKKVVDKLNIDNSIFYFNPAFAALNEYSGGMFDFDAALPRPRSSTQLAMMLALFLGYKKIYLLGVDDDQLSNSQQVNLHFYKQSKDELESETSYLTYLDRLYGKAKTFEGYNVIKRVSDNVGIKIINLNPNSRLDIFDFSTIDDVI